MALQATPEELAKLAKVGHDTASTIEGVRTSVQGEVQMSPEFMRGALGTAFQQVANDWQRAAQRLADALTNVANSVSTTGSSLESGDRQHAQQMGAVGGVSINIPGA